MDALDDDTWPARSKEEEWLCDGEMDGLLEEDAGARDALSRLSMVEVLYWRL